MASDAAPRFSGGSRAQGTRPAGVLLILPKRPEGHEKMGRRRIVAEQVSQSLIMGAPVANFDVDVSTLLGPGVSL
jgi:hypothetical protein